MTKKRFGCFRILLICGVLLVGLIAFWAWMNFSGGPKAGKPLVRVSPETTVITEPLDENGDPDYIEYLNLQQSEGVTPENNAAVLMIQANGPTLEGRPIDDEFYERLGMEPLPPEGVYLVDIDLDEEDSGQADQTAEYRQEELLEMYNFAMKNPWTAEQFPELDAWLQRCSQPLRLLRQASLRPRYYHPYVDPSAHPMVMGILLPLIQASREHSRMFSISAMQHLGEGEIDAAFDDTLTMRRNARLANQSATIVERLVACALEMNAIETEWRIARSGKPSKQQLLDYRAKIDALPPLGNAAECVDHAERYMMLDAIFAIARNRTGDGSLSGGMPSFLFSACDWESAVRVTNPVLDRIVAAMKKDSYEVVQREFDLIEQDLETLETEVLNPRVMTKAIVGGRKAKGELIGNILVVHLTPAFRGIAEATTRTQSFHRLSLLVMSLEAYKIEHGAYPENLDQLIPKYCDELPLDPFVDQPFRYQRIDDTYQLYSVGANLTDDSGIGFDDPNNAGDDLSPTVELQDWDAIQKEIRERWQMDHPEQSLDDCGGVSVE